MPSRSAVLVLILACAGSLSCTRAKVFLKTRQLHDSDASKRRDAASDLGRLGDRSAVEPLIGALSDPDAGVAGEAAVALGLLGDTRAVDALVRAFPSEKWAQNQFSKGLAYLGQSVNIEAAIPVLFRALRNQDEVGQSAVASAIGRAGSKAIEPARAMLDDQGPLMRLGGLRSLVAISLDHPGIEAAVPRLLELLLDRDDKVRGEAANALGRARGPDVGKALIEALAEPDEGVREAVSVALTSHSEAIDDLIAATRGGNLPRRLGAARTLASVSSVDSYGDAGKKARAALDAALENQELAVVAGGRDYYIAHAKGESALLAALDPYGSRMLALDYLNCGNKTLEEAAKAWAGRNGFEVSTRSGKAGTYRWGGR